MSAAPLAGRRAEVFAIVADWPGASPADVARSLGVDHSTATYHLRRLAKLGLVTVEPGRGVVRHFVRGCGLCPYLRHVLPHLREPAAAAALAAVEAGARGAPPPPGAVTRSRLLRLESLGLVEHHRGAWRATDATAVCRERARAAAPCGLWGACEVSRTWPREPAS